MRALNCAKSNGCEKTLCRIINQNIVDCLINIRQISIFIFRAIWRRRGIIVLIGRPCVVVVQRPNHAIVALGRQS